MIVLFEPVIDDDLCLLGRRKPLRIENLPAQRTIEPLAISVLPGRPRVDADRLDTNASKPVLRCFGDELRSIV